jgi:nucleotidyltransferase substrate binding protein (TIGR01987 family)
MSDQDIRWKQRFHNYDKALKHLESALYILEPDFVQIVGIIKLFEISFELAWKLMKDYLEKEGFTEVQTPRAAIKKANEIGLIDQGHDWLQVLEDRNLTVHTYDEEKANQMETLIAHSYFPMMRSLHQKLRSQFHEN